MAASMNLPFAPAAPVEADEGVEPGAPPRGALQGRRSQCSLEPTDLAAQLVAVLLTQAAEPGIRVAGEGEHGSHRVLRRLRTPSPHGHRLGERGGSLLRQ